MFMDLHLLKTNKKLILHQMRNKIFRELEHLQILSKEGSSLKEAIQMKIELLLITFQFRKTILTKESSSNLRTTLLLDQCRGEMNS